MVLHAVLRLQYDCVQKLDSPMDPSAPIIEISATTNNEVEEQVRSRPGMPNKGLILYKIDGIWTDLKEDMELPVELGNTLQMKLIKAPGEKTAFVLHS